MIAAEKIIELKELRIGNILSYKGNYVHVTLISIDADDEYEDTIGFCPMGTRSGEKADWNRALADGLDRVPVTPEILEKCGFDHRHERKNADPQIEFLYEAKVQIMEIWDCQDWEHSCVDIPCKYLHQLQNLFYCLTGQELEIKL